MRIFYKHIAPFVLAVPLLTFSCKKESPITWEEQVSTVETVQAELSAYTDELTSFGTISYKTKNDVTVLVSGTIQNLYYREGAAVQKGTVLAKLRNVQLEIQHEQALNSIESAKAAVQNAQAKKWDTALGIENRLLALSRSDMQIRQKQQEIEKQQEKYTLQKELFDIGGVTESALNDLAFSLQTQKTALEIMEKERESASIGLRDEDLLKQGIIPSKDPAKKISQLIDLNSQSIYAEISGAEAQLNNAYKNLHSSEKLMEELILTAPATGIIGARYYEQGEYVKENEKVFTVIDTSIVSAVFSIQEQDIVFFNQGSTLTVSVQSLNRTVNTVISEISPMADPQSGNFTVKADIQNPDNGIKPGMFVKCIIPRKPAEKMITLPENALVKKTGNKASVFIVINGRLVSRELTLADQKDGILWISDGLKENEQIVLNPSPFFQEGEYVRLR